MSDVRQKAKDLLRLALNEGTTDGERSAAITQLLRLMDKYDLLSAGGKKIDVEASLIDRITNPDFVDGIASRVERIASGIERGLAALKRVTDQVASESGSAPERRRRRGTARRRQ
jgi:hypothetical protein